LKWLLLRMNLHKCNVSRDFLGAGAVQASHRQTSRCYTPAKTPWAAAAETSAPLRPSRLRPMRVRGALTPSWGSEHMEVSLWQAWDVFPHVLDLPSATWGRALSCIAMTPFVRMLGRSCFDSGTHSPGNFGRFSKELSTAPWPYLGGSCHLSRRHLTVSRFPFFLLLTYCCTPHCRQLLCAHLW
jgi:hypothetical protein